MYSLKSRTIEASLFSLFLLLPGEAMVISLDCCMGSKHGLILCAPNGANFAPIRSASSWCIKMPRMFSAITACRGTMAASKPLNLSDFTWTSGCPEYVNKISQNFNICKAKFAHNLHLFPFFQTKLFLTSDKRSFNDIGRNGGVWDCVALPLNVRYP